MVMRSRPGDLVLGGIPGAWQPRHVKVERSKITISDGFGHSVWMSPEQYIQMTELLELVEEDAVRWEFVS